MQHRNAWFCSSHWNFDWLKKSSICDDLSQSSNSIFAVITGAISFMIVFLTLFKLRKCNRLRFIERHFPLHWKLLRMLKMANMLKKHYAFLFSLILKHFLRLNFPLYRIPLVLHLEKKLFVEKPPISNRLVLIIVCDSWQHRQVKGWFQHQCVSMINLNFLQYGPLDISYRLIFVCS